MKPIHLSAVLAIEKKSFPQPWSFSLFIVNLLTDWRPTWFFELKKSDWIYWLLVSFEEAHITTFAIHPIIAVKDWEKIPSICSEFNFESGLSGSFS